MRALFLVNGRSGRGVDLAALTAKIDAAARAARWEHRLHVSLEKSDLDRLVESSEFADLDCVVAIGGDGTVNETGKRLIATGKILGIIPTGSGNGLARHLGLPMRVDDAITALTECAAVDIDTARVNEQTFLGTFGVGFDAVVADRFANAGTRGIETYIREALKAFLAFKPEPYTLTIDDRVVETEAFVIAVANSNQYGNEAKIAPLASLRDGLLDVCVLKNLRLIDTPDIIHRLFRGTLRECSYLTHTHARRLSIQRGGEGVAHVDGEPLRMAARLDISLQPSSLRVLVPAAHVDRI